ncbi:MAG: hypothetical protein KDA61_22040 [Planctomycetales bacterium]|nr:hypothetical protein [Planctomycetales bacterium]
MERTDRNSQIAHQELLLKAKTGRIDLYFLGDSITRRWGCTDPQWSELYANWKANFYGWNAANFGWGGDRVEHMLWRVTHGELEGVGPKVIVVSAGTNNIGRTTGRPDRAEHIVDGVRTLIAACLERAPEARVIVTAIFPRNDAVQDAGLGTWAEISAINKRLAELADQEKIWFLNVNDQLADADGSLRDGLTVDKLHLSAQGCQVWADGLKPLLTEFLGPPAEVDLAPPPTGDPSLRKDGAK